MYLLYANLIHFTTSFTYGNMYEARIYNRVLNWVGEAQDLLTKDYYFAVEYIYGQSGVAIDANIRVQRKVDEVWVTLGYFSPSSPVTLSSIIETDNCKIQSECVPSDIPSETMHYYVPNYYVAGYYV